MAQHDFVFVYGAGISGQACPQVLLDQGEKVILYNDEQKDLEQTFREDMKKRGGKSSFRKTLTLSEKSKLSSFPRDPLYDRCQKAREEKLEIIGEAEYASRLYKGHWMGITGTNGVETITTFLFSDACNAAGSDDGCRQYRLCPFQGIGTHGTGILCGG